MGKWEGRNGRLRGEMEGRGGREKRGRGARRSSKGGSGRGGEEWGMGSEEGWMGVKGY